jgi:hypothetical protein
MDTHFASQLPNPLNGIELRTIGRQEVKTQTSPVVPQPGLQGSRMMVSGVIQNNHHFLSRETVTKKMGQKYLKRLPVKIFPLLRYQFPVSQTDGPKHPNRLMRWGLPEDGVFQLRGNPHHIPGAMLLEMALIQTPKIKVFSSQKLAKFFYMPPALRDLLRQSPPVAYVGEIQTDEKSADIGVPRSLIQRPVSHDATAKFHPTVPGNNQKRWEVSVNPPLIVSSGTNPKKEAALSPRHRVVHSIHPLGNDGTNTGWFGANDPINLPPHTCSSHGKEKVIHVGGDHTGLPAISIFPAGESTLQPLDHRISTFPWLPPFW